MNKCRPLFKAFVLLVVLPAGCGEGGWRWPVLKRESPPRATQDDQPTSLAYRDTVGQYAWIEGLRKMHVRGYGVVVGLGEHGAPTCPREIRTRLLDQLHKRPEFLRPGARSEGWTPERLVDDPGTAVVLVEGEIPAGAVAGSRFDVWVTALPGTQVGSLRGGHLFPTELQYYHLLSPTASLAGKSLAEAQGPVFLNPFSDRPDAATKSAKRVGRVLGGGVVSTDRRLRVELASPSYSKAQSIAVRINTRFPGEPKTADAVSPSFVDLRVPRQYADDPGHFLALVRHVYLPQTSGFAQLRIRQLAEEIVRPDADFAAIALAWEGIGKEALTTVKKFYSHEDASVRFYAGLAGLRLEDALAVDVLAKFAADERSTHRFAAIRALGKAYEVSRSARPVRELLDDPDSRVRIAAYEALRDRIDPELDIHPIGRGGYTLDLVPSSRENLIYAKRTGGRQIAVFGQGLRCEPPLFYQHPSGLVTITADAGDEGLTILWKPAVPDARTRKVETGLDVVELIGLLGAPAPKSSSADLSGLGLDYGTVVQVLYEFCHTRSINARFVLEQPAVSELFGPTRPTGRPESELE